MPVTIRDVTDDRTESQRAYDRNAQTVKKALDEFLRRATFMRDSATKECDCETRKAEKAQWDVVVKEFSALQAKHFA